jgi:hypothetical protein
MEGLCINNPGQKKKMNQSSFILMLRHVAGYKYIRTHTFVNVPIRTSGRGDIKKGTKIRRYGKISTTKIQGIKFMKKSYRYPQD